MDSLSQRELKFFLHSVGNPIYYIFLTGFGTIHRVPDTVYALDAVFPSPSSLKEKIFIVCERLLAETPTKGTH